MRTMNYRVTRPLDASRLTFNSDGLAILMLTGASHQASHRWAMGFQQDGAGSLGLLVEVGEDEPPVTVLDAWATAMAALRAACEPHGLLVVYGDDQGNRETLLVAGLFVVANADCLPERAPDTVAELLALGDGLELGGKS